MIEELLREITSHGHRGAVVPVTYVADLQREMENVKNADSHPDWWIDWMTRCIAGYMPVGFEFEPRSLVTVVTPSPKTLLEFDYKKKPYTVISPPSRSDWEILTYLRAFLSTCGYSVAVYDKLPQKLMAVCCGLGRYGRNNICYSEEFGSYMWVATFVSDLPCEQAPWFPARRMESCESCGACVAACPTGVINPARQVIEAERCLTNLNEQEGEFPDWLDKTAHNCLIGCMRCQDCCPANVFNADNVVQGPSFTEDETVELLAHVPDQPYSDALAAKIAAAGLSEYAQRLPRNLAALFHSLVSTL